MAMLATIGMLSPYASSGEAWSLLTAARQPAPFRSSRHSQRRAADRRVCAQAVSEGVAYPSRRDLLLGLAAVAVTAGPVAPAHADLRSFLQSRQEIYAIAPIGVGQRRLKEAAELLAGATSAKSRREALDIIRAASFNCYQFESREGASLDQRASLWQQSIQEKLPQLVDPCTYRLVAKNVTKLVLDNEAGLRTEVDASLGALLRAFNLLDAALEAAVDGDEAAAEKVADRMAATRSSMDRFDRSIRACLHMKTA